MSGLSCIFNHSYKSGCPVSNLSLTYSLTCVPRTVALYCTFTCQADSSLLSHLAGARQLDLLLTSNITKDISVASHIQHLIT